MTTTPFVKGLIALFALAAALHVACNGDPQLPPAQQPPSALSPPATVPATPNDPTTTPPATTPSTAAGREEKRLTVVISSDLNCWTQPCGCSEDQEGGLPRRATFLRQFDSESTLVLDGGDFACFPPGGSLVTTVRAKFMLRGMTDMGYAAIGLGDRELYAEVSTLRALFDEVPDAPIVCANVFDEKTGTRIGRETLVVERAGLKIGITGVLLDPLIAAINEQYALGYRFDDPATVLAQIVPTLIETTDIQVLLAHVPERTARELAKAFPTFAIVMFSGDTETGPRNYMLPTPADPRAGRAPYLVRDGDRGRSAGVVDLTLSRRPRGDNGGNGGEAAGGRAGWEVAGIGGRIVYLSEAFRDAADMTEMLAGPYLIELRTADLRAAEHEKLPPPGPDALVGVDRCEGCHAEAVREWEATRHAIAYRTLQQKRDEHNPECVGCHTLGYQNPDGGFMSSYQLTDSLTHRNVSCGNCHGFAANHADDREFGVPNPRSVQFPKPSADVCIQCHDAKHHPGFDFAKASRQLGNCCSAR